MCLHWAPRHLPTAPLIRWALDARALEAPAARGRSCSTLLTLRSALGWPCSIHTHTNTHHMRESPCRNPITDEVSVNRGTPDGWRCLYPGDGGFNPAHAQDAPERRFHSRGLGATLRQMSGPPVREKKPGETSGGAWGRWPRYHADRPAHGLSNVPRESRFSQVHAGGEGAPGARPLACLFLMRKYHDAIVGSDLPARTTLTCFSSCLGLSLSFSFSGTAGYFTHKIYLKQINIIWYYVPLAV